MGSYPLNTGTGSVTLVNSPTVTVNAGTLTVGGAMSGASDLTISGTGLLVSTAANSYTGATTIGSGTMQLGTGQAGLDGSLATNGVNINTGAALVYDLAGSQTAGYPFTGGGSLSKLGTGTLTLSVSSASLTGNTTVNAGTLALNVSGANGTILNSPIVVGASATLNLSATGDALGYNNANAPITVYGTMIKTFAESETLFRPITLSGGTMYGRAAAAAPSGSWDFFGTGAVISTASGTSNFIAGAGTADIFSVRTGTAYFNVGANSTLTISVPIMQNSNAGSSPDCNITGPGTMILAGTNYYGTGGTAASAVTIQDGFNSIAGNLELAGSLTFPVNLAPNNVIDGKFAVGYGSTLLITNSANATVQGDLKLGAYASGSSGTANQTGGVLAVTGVDTANGNRSLVIGENDAETSVYNLSAGSLSVPNGWTYLGYLGAGIGNLNISGGSATLAGINFGGAGPSSLSLSGSGLLSIGGSGIVNNGVSAATLGGGTLAANGSWSTNLPMTLTGPATFAVSGNTVGLNGAISGNGSVALVGPGSLALGASSNYNGGTTVTAGLVVHVGNSSALGTGSLNLAGTLDLAPNAGGTLTTASLAIPGQATINLPVFSSTANLALQTGSLTANGAANSVQFSFPQTPLAAGTYRLLGYTGTIGGAGFGAFTVSNPPVLGSRQVGGLENNPNEIDYLVQGATPYWNGQQADWLSTNAWTLNPGGGLTSFEAGDNDVFDDSGKTGTVGPNVSINMGNVNPISVTFNNATSNYTISGSNGIINSPSGATFLQLNGAGTVTIANSNGYTGGTQFNAGTLNINNPSAIGSGLLTIAGSGGGTTGGTLGNTSSAPLRSPRIMPRPGSPISPSTARTT